MYSHVGKLANGFDETAWLILRFREDKLVSMRVGKATTNWKWLPAAFKRHSVMCRSESRSLTTATRLRRAL